MTAVISTGGAGPDLLRASALLRQADLLIAADQGLLRLLDWNRPPDLWVGDGDSLGFVAVPPGVEVLSSPRDKDETDTELAVSAALDRGIDRILLLGGGEGRADHFLAVLGLLRQFSCIAEWYTGEEVILPLSPGRRYLLEARDGPTVSFYPLDPGVQAVSRGLVWELDPVDFSKGMSLSNRIKDQQAEVQVLGGRMIVMRPYE